MMKLLGAQYSGKLFSLGLLFGYFFISLYSYMHYPNIWFLYVALFALMSATLIFFSSTGRILNFHIRLPKFIFNETIFLNIVFSFFFIFAIIALVTSPEIPLLSALSGGGSKEVAILREQFFKARGGWQASFVYINALFAGALLPYCIAKTFLAKYYWRWVIFTLFLLYCLSFMEKAFFLKAVLPLLYLITIGRVGSKVHGFFAAVFIFAMVFVMVTLSGSGGGHGEGEFFANSYIPASPGDHVVWRLFSVPVFTAADSLSFFIDELKSRSLLGATSSLLSLLIGEPRIAFERLVFAYQWGQNQTGTGSANAVFFIEAFVNYGIMGIVIFSIIVGSIFKIFARTKDEALSSIWPLFAIGVYNSGLIGTLASNGFLLVLLISFFVRFKTVDGKV